MRWIVIKPVDSVDPRWTHAQCREVQEHTPTKAEIRNTLGEHLTNTHCCTIATEITGNG